MKVKICGITNKTDALAALEAGADYLGFIFAESKRQVETKEIAEIISQLPDVKKVGVFANQSKEDINQIVRTCGLDYVQLHGAESPKFCQEMIVPVIKAIKIKDKSSLYKLNDYNVWGYLFDTYYQDKLGGGGESFNWDLIRELDLTAELFLAGGIDLANVKEAIKLDNFTVIDVCSGVESRPGKKDLTKLKKLINQIKGA